MLKGINVYVCAGCGKKTTGRKPPARCNKCGGREFTAEALFESRPMTTKTHRPIVTK